MAINPQLSAGTGYTALDVRVHALASILGVTTTDAQDLLIAAKEAARGDTENPNHVGDYTGVGFHPATFDVTRPGDLEGSWSLRCVRQATVDWRTKSMDNGVALLSEPR